MSNEVMDESSMKFTVFMIHALAEAWGISCGEVYRKLNQSGAIDNYLTPHYDVLHTLGEQYLIEDIEEYLKIRGVEIRSNCTS